METNVLIVDAAEMGERPGAVRWLAWRRPHDWHWLAFDISKFVTSVTYQCASLLIE